MDILYQIRARQDAFSAGEGRIAKLMLEDVGFAASASLEELSQRAEVSTATLSRFARSVGCRDLRDLRLQLAQASGVAAASSTRRASQNSQRFIARSWGISRRRCVYICRVSTSAVSAMRSSCWARRG